MTQHATTGVAATEGYEFDENEDAVCRETSSWTTRAGIIQVVCGAIMVIAGVLQLGSSTWDGVESIVGAVVSLVIGATLINAATFLKRVATTEGNDVFNLLGAIDAYKRAFQIQVIVFAVGVALMVVSFVMGGL